MLPVRSNDGQTLVISSSDCYCSILTFEPGELGTPLSPDKIPQILTNQHVCLPTPTESPEQKKHLNNEQQPPSVQAPSVTHNGVPKDSVTDHDSNSEPHKVLHSPSPRPTAEANNFSGVPSPENKPRRIRPTTIATFTSPKQSTNRESPSPTSSGDSVSQSTAPVTDLQGQDKITVPSSSDALPPVSHNNSSQDPRSESQNGTNTSSSNEKPSSGSKGPRRVNFVTLSSFSSSQSNSKDLKPSVISNKSPQSQTAPEKNPIEQRECTERRNEEPMEV